MDAEPCKPRVLIVDDAAENIQLLTEMLYGDCLPVTATNGVQALKLANDDPAPDVILLDIVMPGMNGYEVCTRLKSDQKTKDIPVIFVTELTEKHEERKGFELGGADFITRPFNSHLVMTRIRRQLEIKRYRALHEAPPVLPAFEMELSWELSEHRRAHHEMTLLNEALELRLDECRLQLAEAAEERVRASLKASEDQLELDRLKADLARQRVDFQSLAKELDSLSFSISHDLRAPLRHLVGFSGALQEDYGAKLDAPAQGFLNCITKAGLKMEAQIEALLGLSRVARQQLCISSVDLSQLVREYAAALHGLDPERRVVFSITDRLVVQGDATLLRSAIEHLVHNAWKFTSKMEAATIEFGRAEGEVCPAFYLRDNGAGFDLRYADRLFGAFQRMHKESDFEGVGIGLATVQRIMHRHGGKIWADATVDGGATFYFTLSA